MRPPAARWLARSPSQIAKNGVYIRMRQICRLLAVAPGLLALCAASPAAANPIQVENSRPGTPGWQVPPDAGKVITGYASQTSVAPGQAFQLHVSAPMGSRYRILVYRLGWYQGVGGRLVMCLPGCQRTRAAVAQPAPAAPDPHTGMVIARWSVTDRVRIPPHATSGYYEAKLETVGGSSGGAVGAIPLIVREAAPHSAVLVQVPVNTWQAYNTWGGRSLYDTPTSRHAHVVSFDRPYDGVMLYEQDTRLELPWIHFLERSGVDLGYQTDVDTDERPASLLAHRLVFAIGHAEYWAQATRQALDRARALSSNLMFGSNAGLWRVRYGAGRRSLIEWRNPRSDPVHNPHTATGFYRAFDEPECRLMAVQYEEYAQRPIADPPTPYTVVGAAEDPWLAAARLSPGDVVPGVVGYEWDSLIPGCFRGRVQPLMHAMARGADGVPRAADMVRATAPSGAVVFALGTMELGRALDDFAGRTPDPRVRALITAALSDLERPAPPARLVIRRAGPPLVIRRVRPPFPVRRARPQLLISARLHSPDPRVARVEVDPVGGGPGCADALHSVCRLPAPERPVSYAAVAIDSWGRSHPLLVTVRPG